MEDEERRDVTLLLAMCELTGIMSPTPVYAHTVLLRARAAVAQYEETDGPERALSHVQNWKAKDAT